MLHFSSSSCRSSPQLEYSNIYDNARMGLTLYPTAPTGQSVYGTPPPLGAHSPHSSSSNTVNQYEISALAFTSLLRSTPALYVRPPPLGSQQTCSL